MNFTHGLSTSTYPVGNATRYFNVPSSVYFFTYCMNLILGLPLNSYGLWLICTGKGSGITADFFSLNVTFCEILFCLSGFVFFAGNRFPVLYYVTFFLVSLPCIGRPLFNCMICIERYLAVLHPVSFLKYKPLRYRLVCSVIIWIIIVVCGVLCLFAQYFDNMYIFLSIYLPLFPVLFSIKLFCCLAIVRALKHLGPGEKGKDKEELNYIKKKAIIVILIITVTMFVQYTPMIMVGLLYSTLTEAKLYLSIAVAVFYMFAYVSPLLYIYRVKKM